MGIFKLRTENIERSVVSNSEPEGPFAQLAIDLAIIAFFALLILMVGFAMGNEARAGPRDRDGDGDERRERERDEERHRLLRGHRPYGAL